MTSINLLCVGLGGCGQTYFMNYLKNKKFKINNCDDKDYLKHLSCPSKLPNSINNIKIIYVYSKTFKSICSLFRRNWHNRQIKKLNISKNKKFENIDEYYSLVENNKNDYFGLKNHFLRWKIYKHNNPIYFLNLNNINKKELSEFLNCNIKSFDGLYVKNTIDKYNNLILKYPISYNFYKTIDEDIDKLSKEHNNYHNKFSGK